MTTCCGDYHYADCPTSDPYAYEPDVYDDDLVNDHDILLDPETCPHDSTSTRIFRQHSWKRFRRIAGIVYVKCQHCSRLHVEGEPRGVGAAECIKRAEKICSDCDTELVPIVGKDFDLTDLED